MGIQSLSKAKILRGYIKSFVSILLCIASPFYVCAIEVITHSNQTIEDSTLSVYELRQIFTMRQRVWKNGNNINVFVLPSKSTLHQNFSKNTLKIFPYQLDRIWRKLTYSGLGRMPFVVHSVEELKEAVRSTPGAIGYVDEYHQGDKVNVINISQ